MRTFLLSVAVVGLLGLVPARGAGQDSARAILDQAIQAHGGAERLLRFKASHTKVKGTLFLAREVPFQQEVYSQLPSQVKDILELEDKGKRQTVVTGLNVDKGWWIVNGKSQAVPDNVLAELKDAAQLLRVTRLISLRDTMFELKALGEGTVNGRPALAVVASAKGFRDVKLYFDREYHFLVKVERQLVDVAQKTITEERFLSEYREVDGIWAPKKALILRDGKKFVEADVTEAQFLEKLDDAIFEKP